MEDSLILQKIAEIKMLQDSAIAHIDHVNNVVAGLKGESLLYKLLPLIGVLVGGLITWWAQNTLKEKELKLTIFRELKDTSNKILTALTNLQFQLKELAYLEVDSKYQFHIYCTSTDKKEKDRAYEEHYNDYKYIADVKNKVSMFVAEVSSNFSAHYKLRKLAMPGTVENDLSVFTSHILSLPRSKEFLDEEEVTTEMLEGKITSLATEYVKNINGILAIAKNL